MSLLITDLYREPKHLKALAKEKGINSDLELVSIFGGNTLSLPNKKDVINYYFQKDFNFQSCPAVIKMSLFNMMHFQDQESYTLIIHAIKNNDFAKNLLVQTSYDLAFKKRLCMIFFCTKGPHELAFVKTLRNHSDLLSEHIPFATYFLNPNSLKEKIQNNFLKPSNSLSIKKIIANIIPSPNHPDFNNNFIRPLKVDIMKNTKTPIHLTQFHYDDLFEWHKPIPSIWGQEQLNKALVELPKQPSNKQDTLIEYLKNKWGSSPNLKEYSKLSEEAIITYKELIGAYTYRLVSAIMNDLIDLVPDVDSVKFAGKTNSYSDKDRYNSRLEFWKKYTRQCTNMSFHLPLTKIEKLPNIKQKREVKISNTIPDVLILKFKKFIVVQPLALNETMRWAQRICIFPTPSPYAENLIKMSSLFPENLQDIIDNAPIRVQMLFCWQYYLTKFISEQFSTNTDDKEVLKKLPHDAPEEDAVIVDLRGSINDFEKNDISTKQLREKDDSIFEEDEGTPLFVIARNTGISELKIIDILKNNGWEVENTSDCIASQETELVYETIKQHKEKLK